MFEPRLISALSWTQPESNQIKLPIFSNDNLKHLTKMFINLHWINFTCIGADESNNRFNGDAKARHHPPKEIVLQLLAADSFSFSLSFVTDSCLVLWFVPNQVAQVVQLLQDGKSCVVAKTFALFQHSLKSMEETSGDWQINKESWTGL